MTPRKLSKAEAHAIKLECLAKAILTYQGHGGRWETTLAAAKHYYAWVSAYDKEADDE